MKEFREEYEEMDGLGINVGDFITSPNFEGALFIVSDVYDYTDYDEVDSEIDVVYEVIRIFPIAKKNAEFNLEHTDVFLHSRLNSDKHRITYETIKRLRSERGFEQEPDFMGDFNLISRDVDYSSGATVDDCLDMLNNLDFLYETFGDKEYKDNKKLVMERLVELSNTKKKK